MLAKWLVKRKANVASALVEMMGPEDKEPENDPLLSGTLLSGTTATYRWPSNGTNWVSNGSPANLYPGTWTTNTTANTGGTSGS